MKKWYFSRTILIAILQAIGGVVTAFATTYDGVGALMVLKAIVDAALRFDTYEPVK